MQEPSNISDETPNDYKSQPEENQNQEDQVGYEDDELDFIDVNIETAHVRTVKDFDWRFGEGWQSVLPGSIGQFAVDAVGRHCAL